MKCNKCLKIIPKGEEIRFSSHNSSYRGDGGGYSGCYCEPCWKESKYYKKNEDSGKKGSESGRFSAVNFFGGLATGVIACMGVYVVIRLFSKD